MLAHSGEKLHSAQVYELQQIMWSGWWSEGSHVDSHWREASFLYWLQQIIYAIFGLYGSVFGHFLGVIGVAQCGSMAQNMPLGPIETGEQKNLLPHNF